MMRMTRERKARSHRGAALLPAFTLIELLVSTAIGAVLTVALVGILSQFFQVSTQTTNRLAILGDLSLAAQAISRDVNSAAIATVSGPSNLTLLQPDPNGGPMRTIVYSVSPPLLLRDDGSGAQPLARHIAAGTAFSPGGVITGTSLVNIQLISTIGADSQSTAIQAALRAQP